MATAAEEWWLFCEQVARLRADTLTRNPLVLRNLTRQAHAYLTAENPYSAVDVLRTENAQLHQELEGLKGQRKSRGSHVEERSVA